MTGKERRQAWMALVSLWAEKGGRVLLSAVV